MSETKGSAVRRGQRLATWLGVASAVAFGPVAQAQPVASAPVAGFHADWPQGNLAARARVMPLSIEGRLVGGVAYDMDLLRIAAVWLGGEAQPRRWTQPPLAAPGGTQLTGSRPRPGVADPSQPDPDFGWELPTGAAPSPLPESWGTWLDPSAAGSVRYRVGGAGGAGGAVVVETPAIREADGLSLFIRKLEVADGAAVRLRVVEREGATASVDEDGGRAVISRRPEDPLAVAGPRVLVDRRPDQYGLLEMGGPISGDAGERTDPDGRAPTWGITPGESWPLGASEATARAVVARLHDGEAAGAPLDAARCVEFPAAGARIVLDLGRTVELKQVDSYACGDATGARQAYTLYGHSGEPSPSWAARDPLAAGWTRIAQVDTEFQARAQPGVTGVSVQQPSGQALGGYRRLMFVFTQAGVRLTEIDVMDTATPPKRQPAEPARGEVTLIVLKRQAQGPIATRPSLRPLARNGVQVLVPAGSGRAPFTLVYWVGPATELLRAEAAIGRLAWP